LSDTTGGNGNVLGLGFQRQDGDVQCKQGTGISLRIRSRQESLDLDKK